MVMYIDVLEKYATFLDHPVCYNVCMAYVVAYRVVQ